MCLDQRSIETSDTSSSANFVCTDTAGLDGHYMETASKDSTSATATLPVQILVGNFYHSVGDTVKSFLNKCGQKRSLVSLNCAVRCVKKPKLLNVTQHNSGGCSIVYDDVNVLQHVNESVCEGATQGRVSSDRDLAHNSKKSTLNNTAVNIQHNTSASPSMYKPKPMTSTPQSRSLACQTKLYLSSQTPRKVALRKKLHTSTTAAYRRKNQVINLKRKHKDKLARVCGSSNSMEKVIADVGKYLSGDSFNFVAHQIRMSQHPPKGRRYTEEIRLLSLSLYNSSPKAYAYLAEIFVLPSKISLNKWLRNVRSSPGFNEESFSALSERMKFMPERDRVCCLMVDEISLKQNLQYDQYSDVIVGFEDLGGQYKRSREYAGNALVFMLRGIASNWNQPVGYVFTRKACKADVVKALLMECLEKCDEAGCKVNVVLSDQGPNFQSLVTHLNVKPGKPYFFHANKKYFYMFDPPHLMKSIRNNLHKYTFQFKDSATNKVTQAKWDVIEKYYEIDKMQNFRLTPKLTDNHIYLPPFSKMKVKWATQIFSRSVAAALETHKEILGVNALATAQFVSTFNDIFDTVNSSGLFNAIKLRSAITDNSGHIDFITESVKWIADLKILCNNRDVTNTVKCLQGWQLTLNCILQLWPVLKQDYQFQFLCTRHLNQDPLEQFFSVIRQKSGNCNNPTPFTFAKIYKNVSCQKLLRPVKTGNCEMNVTAILGKLTQCKLPHSKQSIPKPKHTTALNVSPLQQNIIPIIPQWNYEKVKCLEDNALHYVCGYFLRKLKSWHECDACDKILLGGDGYTKRNEIFTHLKKFSPTSKLINASQAFHWYIVRCEKAMIKEFDKCSHKPNIGSLLTDCLKNVTNPSRCLGFPKHKFFAFFVRVRIFYLLKFLNASFNNKKPKNKTKDFRHK